MHISNHKWIGNLWILALGLLLHSCRSGEKGSGSPQNTGRPGSFGYDLAFLSTHHKDLILLGQEGQDGRVIVLPAYQGRVMTSTATGDSGSSFGWINHELIASGKHTPHFSAFGGEERFWIGPEGGQFSVFFKPGAPFAFEHWAVPGDIDTLPFELVSHDAQQASFRKEMTLRNHSGTRFSLRVDRSVRLLKDADILEITGPLAADIRKVGFESDNRMTNTGEKRWEKSTGLLSIWILSMLNAGDATTIAIPYRGKPDSGPVVTDDYFGKVPPHRLRITEKLVLMRADGKQRGKIGLNPARSLPLAASYDADRGVLTLATFSLPEGAADYVNSRWETQDAPFSGDAVNAYNDGPINGQQMGRFYELESSSPAAALEPGGSMQHLHRTIHLTGPKASLEAVARRVLGSSLEGLTFQ